MGHITLYILCIPLLAQQLIYLSKKLVRSLRHREETDGGQQLENSARAALCQLYITMATVQMQWWVLFERMSRLCVETHLRGHVASCNGRVELVKARVEPHSTRDYGSCSEAQELQAKAEEAQRQKEERLLNFQRAVKERVQRRERARQKQLSEASKFRSKRPCPVIRRKVLINPFIL